MSKIILHPSGDGIAVIHPTGELPIKEVARKDAPQGAPYIITDASNLPSSRTFREAWEADFSKPDGYGDPAGWWAEQETRDGDQG